MPQRPFVVLLLLALLTTATAQLMAQQPDTLQAGTPEFEALRLRISEQERIRVTTELGRVELSAPELTEAGLNYGRARFEKRPPRGTRGFRRPLSLSQFSQVDVRVGTPFAGALVGAGFGLAITTGAYGLCGEGCDSGSTSKVGVYIAVTSVTTLIGTMMGRGGWGWRKVYSSNRPAFSLTSIGGDDLAVAFRLPLDAGS